MIAPERKQNRRLSALLPVIQESEFETTMNDKSCMNEKNYRTLKEIDDFFEMRSLQGKLSVANTEKSTEEASVRILPGIMATEDLPLNRQIK